LKNFVTIFPSAQNVHLIKDVGQVANSIATLENYKARLICYKNSDIYSFLDTKTPYLELEFIEPCGRKLFMEKAVLNYIRKNALEIDVIHFFHLTKETIYYALHYKKYNPEGKIYIKMDAYNEMFKGEIKYSKKKMINWFHLQKEKKFLNQIAAISTENPEALDLLKKKFPILKNKAFLLPNGVNNNFLKEVFPILKNHEEKENIILSVGRIGAKDKNFEMLLNAFIKANIPEWKLIFLGRIENDLDKKVKNIISQQPHLKDRIELTGEIDNRKELYEYYNRSKICCLTSPFESFGIVFIEAMYFGNYTIGTTGMSSFDYITNNMELGNKIEVDDEQGLAALIKKISNDTTLLKITHNKAQQQVEEKFYWSKIINSLKEVLN